MPYSLIKHVITHADYKGLRFGRTGFEAAAERAWEAECYNVMLMTGSKKPSTLAFYKAAGFEQSKTGFQVRHVPIRVE